MGIVIIQIVLGIFAFFLFFSGMFNGLTAYLVMVAVASLVVTLGLSYYAGRESTQMGVKAALAFAAPGLLFALLSIGDAFAYGNLYPLLFWSAAGLVAMLAGLVGVGIARKQSPALPKAG
jgi:fucose 4-O-acetylase-like acetyltransferase